MLELLMNYSDTEKFVMEVKLHYRDGNPISYFDVYSKEKTIVLRGDSNRPMEKRQPDISLAVNPINHSSFSLKDLEDILQLGNISTDYEIKMHSLDGNPVLFVVSYLNIPNIAVIEDASDNDLSSELEARFEKAANELMDELDFFMDLLDTGFTLYDIEKYLPKKYKYSKNFMENHGLI